MSQTLDLQAIQHHTLSVLRRTQLITAAGLTTVVAVAVLGASELGASDAVASFAGVALSLGAAVGAAVLSPLMDQRGRRIGLTVGYAGAIVGAGVSLVSFNAGSLVGYVVGMALLGSGQASNLLARYAGSDLAPEHDKAGAISQVVWASTIGAVIGPLLLNPAKALGEALGMEPLAGPFVFSALIWTWGLISSQGLKPDPLLVAREIRPDEQPKQRPSLMTSFRTIAQSRMALFGLITLVVSQGVMVGVMQMTPLHMKDHNHADQVAYVFSTHILGMYAFSPLIGKASTAIGRRTTMLVAGGLLLGAGVMAGVSGSALVPLYAALFLLGIGWNFGLVGGSAALTESVPVAARVGVQGLSDLCMVSSGVISTLAAGAINEFWGFDVLGVVAAVCSAGLLAAVLVARPKPVLLPAA